MFSYFWRFFPSSSFKAIPYFWLTLWQIMSSSFLSLSEYACFKSRNKYPSNRVFESSEKSSVSALFADRMSFTFSLLHWRSFSYIQYCEPAPKKRDLHLATTQSIINWNIQLKNKWNPGIWRSFEGLGFLYKSQS